MKKSDGDFMISLFSLSKRFVLPCLLALAFVATALSLSVAEEIASNGRSFIFVNQIGYFPSSSKIALVSSPTGFPFEVVNAESNQPVLKGMLELSEPRDATSGTDIWAADFHIVQATGRYYINIPGIGASDPFRIDTHLYDPLVRQTLSAFYLHRSGTPLSRGLAGKWARGACHTADGILYSATGGDPIIRNATGGWFDGSDYGKYVPAGVYAAGVLAALYEYAPDRFGDGSLPIPERANGIPDLLDEIRWELEFLCRMQNEEGGIHHKLTALESGKPVSPEKEEEKRYIYPPSTAATAGAGALLAKASRLYSPFDATFAVACLDSARSAWKYLETHPPDGGFENPADTRTKAFRDTDDSDERFWAALELYLTTQEPVFQEAALALAKKRIPLLSASGYWGNVIPLALASILQNKSIALDAFLTKTVETDLLSLANILLETLQHDGFRMSIREGEFTWGSNGVLMQNAMILCLADRLTPHEKYRQGALDQLHVILGRNPLSQSYVTGFGTRSPKNPYHLFSMTDKVEEPVPGLLVAGPNQVFGDNALKRTFVPETAPATIYLDSEESLSSNETDLIWNAVLAFVATYVSQPSQ